MARGQRLHQDAAGHGERDHGLLLGLLIAIPLWSCIGIAVVLLFLERPLSEAESAVLMIAAVCEFILLRHSLRTFDARPRYRALLARYASTARRAGARPPLAKQALALSALVGAYLHYYFWDVHLQIAALPSVTVFVPVQALG